MNVPEAIRAVLADRYRVEREIGAGGMATVYLAEDLKHDRRVALKVLRPELGAVLGPERFLSEIRVTANLQHPHLLPLFDSGEVEGLLFYVMPYVEGESLRARLERERQLPVDEAVRIAVAIAGALDYAHRHGVIHRDLKPENILLHDGQPLIADFGIALAVSNAGGARVTQTGLSLGTPQYMSPEQATGDRVIDGRSDVYALAAVLYEMLVGDPPHVAGTTQAIIAKVLTERPPSVRAYREQVPAHVDAAVQVALAKLPADRFASAGEFADALAGRRAVAITRAGGDATAAPTPPRGWRSALREPVTRAAIVVAVLGWAGLAALGGPVVRGARAADPIGSVTVRFEYEVPPELGQISGPALPYAISPDGRALVYRTVAQGELLRLVLRAMDKRQDRVLASVANASSLTFSPDGRSLAWMTDGSIYRLSLDSGSPVRIASVANVAGMAWHGDDLIIGNTAGGLMVMSAAGGVPRQVTALDSAEMSHRRPVVLPDGDNVLFGTWTRAGGTLRIGIASLRTGRSARLDLSGGFPLGMIDDHLIYHDGEGSILGVPFDVRRWRVSGAPVVLVDSVSGARAVLSASGTLVHYVGVLSRDRELVRVGLDGAELGSIPLRRRFMAPRYAPDGRRIAVAIDGDPTELWLYDARSATLSPVVRGEDATRVEWSPDGAEFLFVSARRGANELWRQRVDGTAPPELVQAASERGQPVQGIFTPDRSRIVYRTGYNGDDVWYRALAGDTTSQPLAADPSFVERHTSISPDGRWAAYASSESGRFQVYVRPFPGPGPRYPVTADGGDTPVWMPDGRRLIYVNGPVFEEATVTLEPTFSVTRRRLFEHRAGMEDWWRNWDLAPDGSHVLLLRAVDASIEAVPRTIVVHNWAAEVRARLGNSPR